MFTHGDLRRIAAALCLAAGFDSNAAGGHFDVDDATILDPGRCQVEAWVARAPADSSTAFHFGPACRVGPIEIDLNVDHLRAADASRSLLGPQLKWVADPLAGSLSAGVVWAAYFDTGRGGRPLQTLYLPFTWGAAKPLRLNVNVGADWGFSGARTRRLGASGEWDANDVLTLIAERANFGGDWVTRLGARFNLNPALSIDLSAARITPSASRVYVIGLNHEFAR
jgi:hypothetical protein